MPKVLVQFDGNNFYNKVKRVLPEIHLTHYNYSGLAHFIANRDVTKTIYYVGEVRQYFRNKKSERLFNNQQSLFLNLSKQKIDIKLGYILKSGSVYHEKGVDVQIAVDLVRGSIKNEFDICYLISSDTDLLPAILTAKQEGKKIVYVAFEDLMSHALLKNCSSFLVLRKEHIQRFSKR